MIDSAVFSRSTVLEIGQQWKADLGDSQKTINRSTLYHLILSFSTLIYEDQSLLRVEKSQIISEFGFNLGKNVTEEESLGNIKYFLVKGQKDKSKPFIGQVKFLNTKVWQSIFGSTSKLFAIVGEGGGYKFEDRDFGLTKWLSGQQEKVRNMRKLLFELGKGVLQGFLDRFELTGEVSFNEVGDNYVNYEIRNLNKRTKTAFK